MRPMPVQQSPAAPGGGWPIRPAPPPATCRPCSDGACCVVVRLLGGRRSWPDGLDAVLASGLPTVVLGGEAAPGRRADGAVHGARRGGRRGPRLPARRRPGQPRPAGPRSCPTRSCSPGTGSTPPQRAARPRRARPPGGAAGPADGGHRVLPRARGRREHRLRGRAGRRGRGRGANALPVFCGSLRAAGQEVYDLLAAAWTRCSSPCSPRAAPVRRRRRDRRRRRRGLGRRRARRAGRPGGPGAVPDLDPRRPGRVHGAALTPMDAAMQVAIPEFDGRLITRAVLVQGDRPGRRAGLRRRPGAGRAGGGHRRAARPAAPPSQRPGRSLAIVLSSYPTKHARVGNAVGLDTPASAVVLLRALRDGRLRPRRRVPRGRRRADPPADRDRRPRRRMADRGPAGRGPAAGAARRLPGMRSTPCPRRCATAVRTHWGEPPGSLYTRRRRASCWPGCGSATWC